MGLEEELYGSKPIRNFLKLFSEHNWNKVTKATLIVGICRLSELAARQEHGFKPLTQTSIDDIERLAIKLTVKTQKRQRAVASKIATHKNVESTPGDSPLRSSLRKSSRGS